MRNFSKALIVLFVIIQNINVFAQNNTKIKSSDNRVFQTSFIHPIGTNGKASGKISNNLSLNVLSGYTGGLNGFELSFFSNIINGKMKGCQLSGFSNINLEKTSGVQIGVFSNVNLGPTNGIQLSGFANVVIDSVKGVQLSGFANIATNEFKGTQISGFSNVVCRESKGVQIAGFINYAKVNRGMQLGFINISDSSSGISIGFLNIIKHGYYNFSLYTDEMLMANLNYKMGSNKFYNIFGVSANTKTWGLTYGIGTHIQPEKKVSVNVDLSFTNMSYKKVFETQLCMKTKLSTDINFRLNKKFDLVAGLSYNIFVSDKMMDKDLQNHISEITNSFIQTSSFKSVKTQRWPGLSLGIKYRL